jgi:UDP-glucose 4-epimerase
LPLSDTKKKVLVTGGAGDIGSRLVKALLKKGFKVKILDCQYGPFKDEKHPNLEFVGIGNDELHGGMADTDAVQKAVTDVDVVYHLAINWDGHTWKHELPLADLFDVNIKGTLNY